MATKPNKRNTPLKSTGDVDPQTPSKVLLRRASRSLSRSESRENVDNSNDVIVSPSVISTRRSTRIIARRSKVKSADDSADDDKPDVKLVENDSDEWEYDVPMNYFKENPDEHVHTHSFKTPKKKDGMVALAFNTPKRIAEMKGFGTPKTPKTPKGLTTPRTPKTPKSSRKLIQPKTPSNVRAKLQKGN